LSENNHYLPIFYQRRWGTRADKRVCVYSRPYKASCKIWKHPAGVGYQTDLYTVSNVDAAAATYLEKQFFLVTDDLAAKALSVIECGQWQPMNTTTRSAWTRFIMSLLHRNPEQVAKSLAVVSQYVSLLKSQYEKLYYEKKDANHPATFDEFWQDILPEIVGRTWIRLVQTTIDSKTVGAHFNNLFWRVVEFKSKSTLMTGDRPIIMTNGMVKPDSHLVIPIGPRKLFVAAPNLDLVNSLAGQNADEVVEFVNDRVVRQAHRFCISSEDRYLQFFDDRFGEMLPSSPVETLPSPTIEELQEMANKDLADEDEEP
jgi:hypothetical protein